MFDLCYIYCNIYLDQSVQKFDLLFNFFDEQGATTVSITFIEIYTKFSATYSIDEGSSISLLYFIAESMCVYCIFI